MSEQPFSGLPAALPIPGLKIEKTKGVHRTGRVFRIIGQTGLWLHLDRQGRHSLTKPPDGRMLAVVQDGADRLAIGEFGRAVTLEAEFAKAGLEFVNVIYKENE